MVPGPQTSWVIRTSTLTHTLSPGCTFALPLARARTFSVRVIRIGKMAARRLFGKWNVSGRARRNPCPEFTSVRPVLTSAHAKADAAFARHFPRGHFLMPEPLGYEGACR